MNAHPCSAPHSPGDATPPNHHADHPGFSGVSGLVAALGFLGGRTAAADLAIRLAGLRSDDRLVDIGCGPGVAVRRASTTVTSAVGVDPATVMLRVARLRWRSLANVHWRIGTAESIPIDECSATVVWSLATVHHWADVGAGLAEVERVLAPGGRFVVLERRIADPHAGGVAGHGWTTDQRDAFAGLCASRGFTGVESGTHDAGTTLLSVFARRA